MVPVDVGLPFGVSVGVGLAAGASVGLDVGESVGLSEGEGVELIVGSGVVVSLAVAVLCPLLLPACINCALCLHRLIGEAIPCELKHCFLPLVLMIAEMATPLPSCCVATRGCKWNCC